MEAEHLEVTKLVSGGPEGVPRAIRAAVACQAGEPRTLAVRRSAACIQIEADGQADAIATLMRRTLIVTSSARTHTGFIATDCDYRTKQARDENFVDFINTANPDLANQIIDPAATFHVPEPGLPPLAPAFTTAIAQLTGKPLRQLPFNIETKS